MSSCHLPHPFLGSLPWPGKPKERPPFSPLSLTSSAALHFWRPQIDFFALPAVQLFGSLAELLVLLPEAGDPDNQKLHLASHLGQRVVLPEPPSTKCRSSCMLLDCKALAILLRPISWPLAERCRRIGRPGLKVPGSNFDVLVFTVSGAFAFWEGAPGTRFLETRSHRV